MPPMPAPAAVPVLMYHHVGPRPGLVTMAPQEFEAQMAWLADRGWNALSAAEFAGFLAGAETPPRSVLITFDDGYLDNWVHAFPILRRHGLRAVIFGITGVIGDGPRRARADQPGATDCPDHKACKAAMASGQPDAAMLRWSEVEAMEAAEVCELASHTHTHTRWDRRIPAGEARLAALGDDLQRSAETLRARLGRKVTHLAWPQGYYQQNYLAVAQRAGFDQLYTTRRRPNPRGASPLEVGRLAAKDGTLWLARSLFIHSRPWLAQVYERLRGGGDGGGT